MFYEVLARQAVLYTYMSNNIFDTLGGTAEGLDHFSH